MEEREKKEKKERREKRRDNERKAISTISQATDTHRYHTETFHRLPTNRQHPEKETIKKQSQAITQATETFQAMLYDIILDYIT